MKLASKRALDYVIGRPVLAALRVAARVLAVIWQRDHANEPFQSILIVKFQGLGSLVIAKPALAELRRRRPEARLLLWCTPSIKTLAEQMPEFDEILLLDDRSALAAGRSTIAVLIRLWRNRIDWAVDLEVYSRLSSVLVTLSCARNRAGFALDQIRSRRVHTHLVYFNRHRHLGEAYARIIGLLLPGDSVVDDSDYGSWRFDLSRLANVPSPYLVFNIHAGELALERRWPLESFQLLIDDLLARLEDTTAVLIGHGPAEAAYCAGISNRSRVLNLTDSLSLVETFRLLANADLVVTNDTAPMHFALSTQTKVVGLFGPTKAETYVAPGRPNAVTASVPLYCSPCVHYWEPLPCNGDNQCMKRLTVSHVLTLCCALLDTPPTETMHVVAADSDGASSTYYPGLVYRRGASPLE